MEAIESLEAKGVGHHLGGRSDEVMCVSRFDQLASVDKSALVGHDREGGEVNRHIEDG